MANPEGVLYIVYQEVLKQANMLAFNDTFWLLGWLTACLVPAVLLLHGPKGNQPKDPIH
mgnify:CR=1 FL=1